MTSDKFLCGLPILQLIENGDVFQKVINTLLIHCVNLFQGTRKEAGQRLQLGNTHVKQICDKVSLCIF